MLIIRGHILFKDKSPYLLGDQTPTCFYTIVLKTNERQFLYIRPEVSVLFSLQIVHRDLTLRPMWPGSAVRPDFFFFFFFFSFSFGNKTRAGDGNQDGTCINLSLLNE